MLTVLDVHGPGPARAVMRVLLVRGHLALAVATQMVVAPAAILFLTLPVKWGDRAATTLVAMLPEKNLCASVDVGQL